MASSIPGVAERTLVLGNRVKGQLQDITTNGVKTYSLFAVTGGDVLITGMWGDVTTSITTDGETLNCQVHPTTGGTIVVVTATDLGTTDTVAGGVLGVTASTLTPATSFKLSGQPAHFIATTGQIESVVVTSSANGVVQWYCTYIPLTDGAAVAASVVAPV